MEDELIREEVLTIDLRNIEIEKRHKPNQEVLKQLKYIKKLRRENKKESITQEAIEQDIGFLLSQDVRGKNREELIKLIIFKLQELQIQKHIIDFSRVFLRNIFKDYSHLSDRVIQLRMEELLIYAKARERVKTNRALENAGIKNCQELINKPRNKIFQSYSFINL